MKKTKPLVARICSLSLLLLCVTTVTAKEKFAHAVERSQDAGQIIASLALVPESGFPKELAEKAEAIAVFPRVEKETSLFSEFNQGYGVISSRTKNGWTLPAFYQFSGGGFGGSLFADKDTFGIILLFMTPDAVAAFEKGGVPLKGEKKALAGPIGTITDEQRRELEARTFWPTSISTAG